MPDNGRVRLRPNRGFPRCLACDITPVNKLNRDRASALKIKKARYRARYRSFACCRSKSGPVEADFALRIRLTSYASACVFFPELISDQSRINSTFMVMISSVNNRSGSAPRL
jgi:hypothetical protein